MYVYLTTLYRIMSTTHPFLPSRRYLYSVGSSMFKQKRKRFFTLIQLSQYKFLFCSYQPNGTQPKETLLLDQEVSVEYASDNGQDITSGYCSVKHSVNCLSC